MQIIIGAVAIFMAGLVQGCAGFGLGMVAAPSLMLFLNPVTVVPTVISLSSVNAFLISWEARRHLRPRMILPLALGGIVGLPLGVMALKSMNPVLTKGAVGVIILLFSAAWFTGWRKALPGGIWAMTPVGLVSGFLGGSTAMGGPPIILFLASQKIPRDIFRANLASYFCIASFYTVAIYWFSDLYTVEVFRNSLFLLPCLVTGTATGVYLSRRIPEETFSRVVMILLSFMGIMLLSTSIYAFAA